MNPNYEKVRTNIFYKKVLISAFRKTLQIEDWEVRSKEIEKLMKRRS